MHCMTADNCAQLMQQSSFTVTLRHHIIISINVSENTSNVVSSPLSRSRICGPFGDPP